MKIILLLPQLVYGRHGGFVGGYVNSVLNLAAVLQDACDLIVVAGVAQPSKAGRTELDAKLKRARLCLLPMSSTPSSAAYFAEFSWKARRTCLGADLANADFVYGHSGHPGYGLSTWLAGRAAGARSVHALYCPVSEEFQHRKMGLATKLLVHQALRRVPAMVAISENVRETIRQFTRDRVNAHVILPAIPDDFLAAAKAPENLPDQRPLVLGFVGHHKPEKGFDLALAAVRAAIDRGQAVKLLALTSGAESQGQAGDEVAAMINHYGLAGSVQSVKGIKDIRDFYAQLDLMLIPFRGTRGPSDYPMVLLEAMSLSVPVVCTPVGAMPEVVRHGRNGFLSHDTSTAAFSSVVAEAIGAIGARKDEIAGSALSSAVPFRARQVSQTTLQLFNQLSRSPRP